MNRFVHKAATAGLAAVLMMGAAAPSALAVTQADLASAQERMNSLGAQLGTLSSTMEEQEKAVDDTQAKIDQTQEKIDQTTQDLADARSVLSKRMRATYKTGGNSLASVILGSSSIDQIVSNIYYADAIADQDAAAIKQVQTLEAELKSEGDQLKQKKDEQEKVLAETRKQAQSYTHKLNEAQAYYNSLDSELQAQLTAQAKAEEEAAAAAAVQSNSTAKQSNATVAIEAIQSTSAEAQKDATEVPAKTQESTEKKAQVQTKTQQVEQKGASGETTQGRSSVPSGQGIATAEAAIGSPYVRGAEGPNAFDCSGLVCYAYGYGRGRSTSSMISSLKASGDWKTSMSDLSAGDLVFTSPGHVGIYVGGGMMIDAPHSGRTVTKRAVYSFYGGGSY